jgi:dTDP-4-dehydrorhamnose 3,5-epimerase
VDIRSLAVQDAWEVVPATFTDDRGTLVEWFRADRLDEATGHRFVPVQANQSISRRGVLRGLHYADVPPGQAKYVCCLSGAVLDVVVDVRLGSPTFGQLDSVRLDGESRRGVFIAEGLGHAFTAVTATATVVYLLSSRYDPSIERSVHPLDPELAWPWPPGQQPLLSRRDADAPTLAAARAAGVLPSYAACRSRYEARRRTGQ